MSLLEAWVQTPGAAALGWTLVHSLWEGAILALVLAVALCFLRSSRARYAAGCLAMLGLLGALCLTFARVMPQQRPPRIATGVLPVPAARRRTRRHVAGHQEERYMRRTICRGSLPSGSPESSSSICAA